MSVDVQKVRRTGSAWNTAWLIIGLLLLASFEQEDPTGILGSLSLINRMEDLTHGLLRFSDLAFFLVFIVVGVLATQQRIALRRWS